MEITPAPTAGHRFRRSGVLVRARSDPEGPVGHKPVISILLEAAHDQ